MGPPSTDTTLPSAGAKNARSPSPCPPPSSPRLAPSSPNALLHHRPLTPLSPHMQTIELGDSPNYPPLPGRTGGRGLHMPTLVSHQEHLAYTHTKRRRGLACITVALLIGAQCLYAVTVASSGADADGSSSSSSGSGEERGAMNENVVSNGGHSRAGGNSDTDRVNGKVTSGVGAKEPDRVSTSHSSRHHPRILYVLKSSNGDRESRKGAKRKRKQRIGKHNSSSFDDNLQFVSEEYRAAGLPASPPIGRIVELYPAEYSDETQLYSDADSADPPFNETMKIRNFPPSRQEGGGDDDECRPMADWQTTFHPTCNVFHEVDLPVTLQWDQLSHLGSGNWRDAWKLRPQPQLKNDAVGSNLIELSLNDAPVVVKTWRFMHRVEDEYFELNRIDAVAMERLTTSPYVINIHGFCGLSIATEYATETLTAVADKLDGLGKLRLVRQIAEGLAHIHGIDSDEHASLVHNDLNTAHIMMTDDGVPLLNDFNIANLMLWDGSKKYCGFTSDRWNPQWRSPEEIRSLRGLDHHPLTESIDIYALGNVLFRFVTGGRAWYKGHGSMTEDYLNEIAEWKYTGEIPSVPEKIETSKDPAVRALLKVMKQCYSFDPRKRPKARDIVRKLDKLIADAEVGKVKEKE